MRSPWFAVAAFVAVLAAPLSAQAQSNAQNEEAQYQQAIKLYNLGLHVPAFGIFAEIADKPTHARFQDTLSWLATLANDLPEPADVMERIGKYDDAKMALFNNAKQREIYWSVHYWHGRYEYRNRRYDEAIADLARVDASSPLFAKAQFFAAMANVQTRRSVPAATAFRRIINWLDDGDHADAGRLRDLANISLARTYYSASVRMDADTNTPVINAMMLSAAVKYFRRVDVAGDYFLDSLFEEAWARYIAGDYAHALGNVRMLASPELPARYPEAAVLEGVILFGTCRYEEANAAMVKMTQTYKARRAELTNAIDTLEKMDDVMKVRFLRSATGAVADAISDRMLAGHFSYLAYLSTEKARFDQLPASFRTTKIANDSADMIALATDIEQRNAGSLATERLQRARAELDDQLRNAVKVQIDIIAAQRNMLEAGSMNFVDTSPPPPKPTTLSWPINGTSGFESFGAYRANVGTKCPTR